MIWLFRVHPGPMLFGVLCYFLAGLGQTYLLAQFIPHLQSALEFSHTQMSGAYSLATFISSLGLSFVGGLLDRWSLKRFCLWTFFGLSAGYTLLAHAQGLITLFFAFFLIRAFGQMNFGLMASTTLSRLFGQHRGKALTWAQFGRSLGEGVLPVMVASFIAWWGWSGAGLGVVFVLIGFVVLLWWGPMALTDLTRVRFAESAESLKLQQRSGAERQFNWREYLREKKALAMMILGAVVPFLVTGLFFMQGSLATMKEVDLVVMANSFVIFSIVQFSGNLLWGPLIDRLSARALLPWGMLPMAAALSSLIWLPGELAVGSYMACLGLCVGLVAMARNSFWAEVYGPKQLGQHKGMDSMILVMGTALGPIALAWLLDAGVSFESILHGMLGLTLLTGLALLVVTRSYENESGP